MSGQSSTMLYSMAMTLNVVVNIEGLGRSPQGVICTTCPLPQEEQIDCYSLTTSKRSLAASLKFYTRQNMANENI